MSEQRPGSERGESFVDLSRAQRVAGDIFNDTIVRGIGLAELTVGMGVTVAGLIVTLTGNLPFGLPIVFFGGAAVLGGGAKVIEGAKNW